jgi:hypothetical protein
MVIITIDPIPIVFSEMERSVAAGGGGTLKISAASAKYLFIAFHSLESGHSDRALRLH